MQKAQAKHFSPRRARRTRRENDNMFCLCFVIFVFFVVRKLAIVFNLGFPDTHEKYYLGKKYLGAYPESPSYYKKISATSAFSMVG